MNQIEQRRNAIAERFAHSWSKSSTRIPISVKEYRALLDLWEAVKVNKDQMPGTVTESLQKLERV